MPHGREDVVASGAVGQGVAVGLDVGRVSVVAQLGGVEQAAVIEKLGDELAGAHARVAVGESQNGCECRHHQHLQDWVVTQACRFAPPTPGDVRPDKEGSPDASEDAQEHKGHQLNKVPGGVKLHVEQHQSAVSERVDGAQREGCHKGSEERTPQCF